MSAFQVREVDVASPDFPAFLDLPWRLYPGRHAWVPPLKAQTAFELSPQNLFFTHGEAQAFLAFDDGVPVGRIVASVDHALVDATVGHFGYFEVEERPEVAHALLDAAAAWVRARGRTQLHGPVNLSIYHQYRVMTQGFDRPAHYGEPRSPRYYLALLEQAGFLAHARWFSWDIPSAFFKPLVSALETQLAGIERALPGFTLAPLDLANFEAECARLHPIIRETFRENYGGTDVSAEEFLQRFYDARHFMHPGACLKVCDPQGNVVGYSYTYADPSPDFARADGDAARLSFSPAGRDRPFIAHTFGILKAHRKSGIAEWIFKDGTRAMCEGYDQAVGALAKEGPAMYQRFGEPSRAYAVYARTL